MLEHRQATDGRSGGSFATQAPSYTAFTRVQVLVKVPRFIRIKSRSLRVCTKRGGYDVSSAKKWRLFCEVHSCAFYAHYKRITCALFAHFMHFYAVLRMRPNAGCIRGGFCEFAKSIHAHSTCFLSAFNMHFLRILHSVHRGCLSTRVHQVWCIRVHFHAF